jgi:hypothetical protein
VRFVGDQNAYVYSRLTFRVVPHGWHRTSVQLVSTNTNDLNIAPEGDVEFIVYANTPLTLNVAGQK